MLSVIFYKAIHGNKLDKFISLYSGGQYSHCEIKFSDDICFSSSARDGGTRFKKINLSSGHWDEVPIEYSHNSLSEQDIREWCESHVGLPYNFLGLVGISLPFFKRDINKWYCSEICFYSLVRGKRMHISPTALFDILIFNNTLK